MQWNEFQEKALRTESIVDELEINEEFVRDALNLFVQASELLDCLKKAIYYKNPKKFNDKAGVILHDSAILLDDLIDTLDVNEGSPLDVSPSKLKVNPRVFHGIIGAATESGELVSALLKGMATGNIDKINVMEEMADGAAGGWYGAVICDALDIKMEDGWERVINKLTIRYPEKYTDEAAANRNLESERHALEGN